MDVVIYKCPNCDAGLVFDPTSQKFHCEYCTEYFTKRELETRSPVPNASAQAREEEAHAAAIYSCPACGAEIVTDETTAATFCYYCHNPVVVSSRLAGGLKPDKVLPFAIDRERAVKELLGWVKKKWFVPKDFFSPSQIEKVTGVYFPYWMVDAQVSATLDARATKVKTWRTGNTQYTETEYYDVRRAGDMDFKEIAKNALNKENSKLINGVHPYDFSQAEDFSTAYLTGFQAEKRNVERADCENEVRCELGDYSKALLLGSVNGYSGATANGFNIGKSDTKWSYTLLPAWVLTYKAGGGKTYYYAMNGQSGKASGVLPVSFKKLLSFFAGVSAALFLILLAGSYLL